MINSIKVTTGSGLTETLELRRPELSGLLIRSVSGVGPGVVDIKSTDYASLPGAIYSGNRKPSRNIVIDLVAMWKTTVEECRHTVERLFKIGDDIKLTFYTETRSCYITGVVESNEPDIFNSDGLDGIPCQISIICYDPRFFDVDDTVLVSKTAYLSGVSFPLTIPPTTPMGILDSDNKFNITYTGTEDEGFTFLFKVKQNITSLQIINYSTGKYMYIAGASPILTNGDELTINTRIGEKSIMALRDNRNYNYLTYFDIYSSEWLELRPGLNSFVIKTNGIDSSSAFNIRVSYTKAYWGI